MVLTAGYILWTVQRVYLGTNPAYKEYPDMNLREVLIAVPLVVLSVALGIFPSYLLLSWMEPSVSTLGFCASICREARSCRLETISAAIGIGSMPVCG